MFGWTRSKRSCASTRTPIVIQTLMILIHKLLFYLKPANGYKYKMLKHPLSVDTSIQWPKESPTWKSPSHFCVIWENSFLHLFHSSKWLDQWKQRKPIISLTSNDMIFINCFFFTLKIIENIFCVWPQQKIYPIALLLMKIPVNVWIKQHARCVTLSERCNFIVDDSTIGRVKIIATTFRHFFIRILNAQHYKMACAYLSKIESRKKNTKNQR